jgi:GR25 family glycosyltransferase involved in LPS biosynthesis
MAVEEIRHNKMGPTLVLEDDVKLPESFMFKLRDAIHALPADWDVAALSWFIGTQCSANWNSVNEHWQTFTKGDVWGQAAYLVNGSKGAERILNCIHPVYSHIDRMFWESCRDGKMKGYFSIHQLVHQTWDFESQNI